MLNTVDIILGSSSTCCADLSRKRDFSFEGKKKQLLRHNSLGNFISNQRLRFSDGGIVPISRSFEVIILQSSNRQLFNTLSGWKDERQKKDTDSRSKTSLTARLNTKDKKMPFNFLIDINKLMDSGSKRIYNPKYNINTLIDFIKQLSAYTEEKSPIPFVQMKKNRT